MDDVVLQQRPELLSEVVILNLHDRVLVQNIAPVAMRWLSSACPLQMFRLCRCCSACQSDLERFQLSIFLAGVAPSYVVSVERQGSSHLIERVAELLRAVTDGAQVHCPPRRPDQQPPELIGFCTGLGGRACSVSRTSVALMAVAL